MKEVKKAILILVSPDTEGLKNRLVTTSCKTFGEILQKNGVAVDTVDLYKEAEEGEFDLLYYPGKESVKSLEYQVRLTRSDLIVFFFPIWLHTMPAILKSFLEQVLTPDFANANQKNNFEPELKNKQIKIIVFDRDSAWKSSLLFRDGLKLLWKRGILADSGADFEMINVASLSKMDEKIFKSKVDKIIQNLSESLGYEKSLIDLI